MFLYPLQVFLVPLPNAAIYSAHTWLPFIIINYAYLSKKDIPGQVRSGHQSEFVDTTTEKFAIMSEQ